MTDLARSDLADPDRMGHSPGDRRAVAGFGSYPEAEAAVDRLAEAGFPVDRAAIAGRGLVVMEVGARIGDRVALRAATYEVLADEEIAEEAARLLDR